MTGMTFGHVGITVSNLSRSVNFYRDLLGLSLTGQGEIRASWLGAIVGREAVRVRYAELRSADGTLLELFEYQTPGRTDSASEPWHPGTVHVALVVSDIGQLWERLKAHGVKTHSAEPVTITEPPKARCGYLRDPDGLLIELCEPLDDM